MSVSKNGKQRQGTATVKAITHKSSPKMPGTRAGTLEDWRLSGKGTGDSPAARRTRLRDGQ
ncbi:MAG: hypothetical protein QOK48_978 [Blastocatellia bacterium]|jgi:hypothetical protein|nr:hypothetical protein [Blastocatellia bacterium]